jgi:hypothetical protein
MVLPLDAQVRFQLVQLPTAIFSVPDVQGFADANDSEDRF